MELLILDFYYIKKAYYTLKFIPLLKKIALITATDIFTISIKTIWKNSPKTFRFQYENNVVYKEFCDLLQTNVSKVKSLQFHFTNSVF
jgi:hypothetical protein